MLDLSLRRERNFWARLLSAGDDDEDAEGPLEEAEEDRKPRF